MTLFEKLVILAPTLRFLATSALVPGYYSIASARLRKDALRVIFDMPTSCPAAPVLLSKLISKGYMLYESLQSKPRVAHFNDLLRQQSENAF